MHEHSIQQPRIPFGAIALLLGCIALVAVVTWRLAHELPRIRLTPPPTTLHVVVSRVVDGDTLKIRNTDGSEDTVRLLGVDTPETKHPDLPVQCWGPQASAWLDARARGKAVTLIADSLNDDRDKYDRLLRYMILAGEQESVNLALVREGQAFAYTRYPFQHESAYVAAEEAARAARLGLWSDACPYDAERIPVYRDGTGR